MGWSKLKVQSLKLKALVLGWCCFVLLAFCFSPVQAQTFAEWFSQGKTQMKYLTEQIAALQAFRSSIRQGYAVMSGGLGGIGGFTGAEMGFHRDHYAALRVVNPVVRNEPDWAKAAMLERGIVTAFTGLAALEGLQADERVYIVSVRDGVFKAKEADQAELDLAAGGEVKLSDAERLLRLRRVVVDLQEALVFSRAFAERVRSLVLQRSAEISDAELIRRLYGLD
ncbi:MAG: hypothetical protein V4592_08410 [Bacteroidota bacterium]